MNQHTSSTLFNINAALAPVSYFLIYHHQSTVSLGKNLSRNQTYIRRRFWVYLLLSLESIYLKKKDKNQKQNPLILLVQLKYSIQRLLNTNSGLDAAFVNSIRLKT
ncbi:hypothetical protein BpHYR1_012730 [Brachionus plicatilis]|uniref:Uncharacterized protein n=1 Tax=Brachionus plicatilis TaxID=10195 RepID=A0A3M7T270_BRAPC|nr:hypothetical protein BpHYR1_012730 [Brachionus plicatilis]